MFADKRDFPYFWGMMKKIPYLLLFIILFCSCGVSYTGGRKNSSADDRRTGSVSKVDMKNAETYNNIYDYLRGRVPGVQVVGNSSIRIRGAGAPNSNAEPLILVDGVETSDISDLNPSDVASVEILKDGTAALYGMRGANGVIIIKTK